MPLIHVSCSSRLIPWGGTLALAETLMCPEIGVGRSTEFLVLD